MLELVDFAKIYFSVCNPPIFKKGAIRAKRHGDFRQFSN